MNRMDLPVKDSIYLLISGISQSSLRAIALSVADGSVDEFLERMRQITEGCTKPEKKMQSSSASKNKNGVCKNCGKKGHTHQECRGDTVCFYCKTKGYRQYECPAIKNKATNKAAVSTRSATQATAAISNEVTPNNVVAAVGESDNKRLELDKLFVKISRLWSVIAI